MINNATETINTNNDSLFKSAIGSYLGASILTLLALAALAGAGALALWLKSQMGIHPELVGTRLGFGLTIMGGCVGLSLVLGSFAVDHVKQALKLRKGRIQSPHADPVNL